MLTATLGGLIKDYRIRKRLSQLEVSLRIGWKDTSRLSKIEQGRVGKPTRPTVEKIIKALDLTDQEKGEFLYVGGFLPTDEEIEKKIALEKSKVDDWPFPAYIMDFSERILWANDITLKAFDIPLSQKRNLVKMKLNLLEYVYDPEITRKFTIKKKVKNGNFEPFNIAEVAQYKINLGEYEDCRWYKQLVERLSKYELFRSVWGTIKTEDYAKNFSNYWYISVKNNSTKEVTNFHVFSSQFIDDPRFHINFYVEDTIK